MSEIVRPTRDGIHGREYISTVIDIGRRPAFLKFGPDGKLINEPLPFVRIPIPIVFDILPFGDLSPEVWKAIAQPRQQPTDPDGGSGGGGSGT